MPEEIIKLENVNFQVDQQKILKNINLSIDKRKIITITGPSGGGKSTLLKLIGLLINPTSGTIYFEGKNILEFEPTEYRKQVSYFFQNAVLFGETVRDNLSFPAEIREDRFDEERAIEGLEMVQLPSTYLDKEVKDLSGGEKQRIALIRNLMYPPKVLLMDEVTSSLDKENREVITSFISRLSKEEEVTVLWITHNQEEIDASNEVFTIVDGELEEN